MHRPRQVPYANAFGLKDSRRQLLRDYLQEAPLLPLGGPIIA
jgi:hypothetical protein